MLRPPVRAGRRRRSNIARLLSSRTCIGESWELLPLGLDSGLIPLIAAKLLSGGSIVNSEAGCLLCSQARVLKAVFPVAKGYELKLYECASCSSDLLLVTRVSKLSAHKQPRGRSPRSFL